MPPPRIHRTVLSLLILLLSLPASAGDGTIGSKGASPSPTEPASQTRTEITIDPARTVASSALGRCFRYAPKYPPAALRYGQEGRTLVRFEVSRDGIAENPVTQISSGFPLLDVAALNHMRGCIERTAVETKGLLPAGRYALPMDWRLE